MNEQDTTSLPNHVLPGAAAPAPSTGVDYDAAVDEFYEPLYRFALGLTGNPADAADLTQDTFQTLILKSDQIRDVRKLKSWLFSTLYRRFLVKRRRNCRFPEVNVEDAESELPVIPPDSAERLDTTILLTTLQSLEEKYRAPLVMFYLQELSYREIAGVLSIPIGTVMSRLSRGKDLLRNRLGTTWRLETRNIHVTKSLLPVENAVNGCIFSANPSLAGEPAWGI